MHLVPWNYDFTGEQFDGLFISNGPGDPAMAHSTIENVAKVLNCTQMYCIVLHCSLL